MAEREDDRRPVEAQRPASEREGATGGEPPEQLPASRRRFLGRVALTAGTIGAGLVVVPLCAVVLDPLDTPEPVWHPLGPVDAFAIGGTSKVTFVDPEALPWAGAVARTAAWLRREAADRFVAFSGYCTHAGCPVRWEEGAQFFLCPCHGGVFHRDGSVAAGPPARPLPSLQVRVRQGQVEILTDPRLTRVG